MTGVQHRPSPTPSLASTLAFGASPKPAQENGGLGQVPAPKISFPFRRATGVQGPHGYSNRYGPGVTARAFGANPANPLLQHQQNRGAGLNRNAREPPAGPASWVRKLMEKK